jgi:hypothetical protein
MVVRKRIGSALLTAALFAGCAANDGQSTEPAVESNEATATQAAVPCGAVTATLNQHLAASRARVQTTQFFIWQITAFYAVNYDVTQAPEYLGADGNQVVTLYTAANGAWTAVQANCVPPLICGDGVHNASPSIPEGIEPCDGADLDGKTCGDFGYSGGTLACKSDCHFDFSRCQTQCGNGRREGSEVCDGSDTPIKACAELDRSQYTSGTVKCAADCTYDVSGCTKAFCGDGIVTTGDDRENCDGTNLNGATCATVGEFSGGVLKCDSQCRFDRSGCVVACGDGKIDPVHEECDSNTLINPNYPSFRCADYVFPEATWPWNTQVKYASGTMTCDASCRLNRLPCKPPPGCYVACATPGICGLDCR